jgi:hypothetical protein
MNIMCTLGVTLPRWCNVTTCMIKKIKGNPRLNKLCVIHIDKADYNLILKITWARKCIWQAGKYNKLHEGQVGSRPHQRATDVVVHKEMRYMYARLTRTQLGSIDNDAKRCFDCILCNLAMLGSWYNGAPLNFCKVYKHQLVY